jgi:hypothetical protein
MKAGSNKGYSFPHKVGRQAMLLGSKIKAIAPNDLTHFAFLP